MSTNPTPPDPSQGANLGGRLEELRVGVDWLMKETYRQREELRLVREQGEVAQNHQVQAIVELHQTTRELRRTVDELHQQIQAMTPPAPAQAAQYTQNPPPKWVKIVIVALAAMLLLIFIVSTIFGFVRSSSWFLGSISSLVALILLAILVAYIFDLKWTGLPDQSGPPGSKDIFYQGPKTVWDWIQIVIIPVVLLYIAGSIATSQQAISNDAFNMQHAADVQMAQDQLNESELSTYLANIAALLQQQDVRASNQAGVDIRSIARAQTLTLLEELATDPNLNADPKYATTQPNSERKARVLKFLYDSGLISRNPSPNSFPIVNLADVDFSYANLHDINLNGADLAGANFSDADLSGAMLNSTDLSQATLNYANLNGAKLTYAPIRDAHLMHTDLTGADLSGADLTGANLSNAIFTKATDITGTTPPTQAGFSDPHKIPTVWKLIQIDTIVTIAYNEGTTLPAYGTLDLSTSKLQLIYGAYSNKGTAIVLLPAFWSQKNCATDYCETAQINITRKFTDIVADASQPTSRLAIPLSGTIGGLQVDVILDFSPPPPGQNSISVTVTVNAPHAKTIPLDTSHSIDAFKPIILRSIFNTQQLSTKGAFIGSNTLMFQLPSVYHPIEGMEAQTFGLIGNETQSMTANTPTITVTMNDSLSLRTTVEVQPPNPKDSSANNVSLWGIFKGTQNIWPDTWSYTVVATNPYHIASQS